MSIDTTNDRLKTYRDLASRIRAHCLRMTHDGAKRSRRQHAVDGRVAGGSLHAHLRVDPQNPRWPQRDRFILSKGHGGGAVYAVLAEKGFFPRGGSRPTTGTTAG